jgi:hypothetical protein
VIRRKQALGPRMRISVVGPPSLSAEQIRAYAEYKFFSRLVTVAAGGCPVQVVVTTLDADSPATCTVAVDLGGAGFVRTRVRRAGAVPAVDAAADTIARAAARRLAERTT